MKENQDKYDRATCIIIDDEIGATDTLTAFLSRESRLTVVDVINDPREALRSILHNKPDILFLDIQMPGMDGFEVAEAISHTSVRPFIIFVTAFDEFAIRAIKVSAFDYLLKPIDEAELTLSIERFMNHFAQRELESNYVALLEHAFEKKLKFKTTGGYTLISPRDILFIKADWNYSEIYSNKERPELIPMNIGEVEHLLPKKSFARISRSVIINLTYLERVNRVKRICILKKDSTEYEFRIPILRIRYLDGLL